MAQLSETSLAVLRSLRHGALTLMEVADDIGKPPFTTRAELLNLKRGRLVTDHFVSRGHLWELTVTGCGVAWSSEQLELDVGPDWLRAS